MDNRIYHMAGHNVTVDWHLNIYISISHGWSWCHITSWWCREPGLLLPGVISLWVWSGQDAPTKQPLTSAATKNKTDICILINGTVNLFHMLIKENRQSASLYILYHIYLLLLSYFNVSSKANLYLHSENLYVTLFIWARVWVIHRPRYRSGFTYNSILIFPTISLTVAISCSLSCGESSIKLCSLAI